MSGSMAQNAFLRPVMSRIEPFTVKASPVSKRSSILKSRMGLNQRRRSFTIFALLVSVLTQTAHGAETSWNKIRYQGGTVEVKVNPFDWNTTLRVSASSIMIDFASLKQITIDAHDVISLSHGETAYHRVVDMLASSPVSRPVPLFGIIHAGKDHLVGIEFKNQDGSRGGVLLLVHKDSYRALLQAVSELTNKPIEGSP